MTPRYFIDANIIMDALLHRENEPAEAMRLIDLGYHRRVQLLVTPMSLGFLLAMLQVKKSSKKPGPKLNMVRSMMHDLLLNIEVIPAGKADFMWALNSNFYDIEDGAQYSAAMAHGRLDAIVTRDPDYKDRTALPLFTASEALADYAARMATPVRKRSKRK